MMRESTLRCPRSCTSEVLAALDTEAGRVGGAQLRSHLPVSADAWVMVTDMLEGLRVCRHPSGSSCSRMHRQDL